MKPLFLFIAALALCGSLFSQNRSIQFDEGKWADITAKARQQNKPIFLDGFTVWCGPCKWQAKNVFTNDTVADFYNSHFICARFDMEKGEGIELAKKYQVQVFPSALFIDSNGEILHRVAGASPAKPFVEEGLKAFNPYENFRFYKNKYKSGCLEPSFISAYLKILQSAYLRTDSVLIAWFNTQHDSSLNSRTNWNIIYNYSNNIDSRELTYLLKHTGEFSALYTADSVNNKLFGIFMNKCFNYLYSPDFSDSKYLELKTQVKNSGFTRADEVIFNVDMECYAKAKDWKNYALVTMEGVDKFLSKNAMMLNQVAWTYFESIKDKKQLAKALEWAIKSVELDKNSASMDTQANLLFKLGKKAEAIKLEEEALKMATDSGQPTDDYTKALETFKK